MPNHYAGDLRRTLAISGLSHVRTELPHLLVIPLLTPHPVESNREFPRHGYLGNPSLSSHGQVEKPARRQSGSVPTVTWAASTSRKRSRELPCLLMWPSRRRSPLDSSDGTS